MRERGELEAVPTLGFYSHVDQDTRRRAEAAGLIARGAALADGARDGRAGGGAAAAGLTALIRRTPDVTCATLAACWEA